MVIVAKVVNVRTFDASRLRMARITRRTVAGGVVIGDFAFSVWSAVARVDAESVYASLSACTFAVRFATNSCGG